MIRNPDQWTLAELTELDIRLGGELPSETEVRDRPEGAEGLRRDVLLLRWLRLVRERDPAPAKAAKGAVRAERWIRAGMILLFFLGGVGVTQGLLVYEGERLINVSAYLGVLVFGQLGLLVLLGVSGLILRRSLAGPYRSLLLRFMGTEKGMRSLPAWSARAFASVQTAGAGFNLGVLATTAVRGVATDLAFGWGTTLRVTGGEVHRLVSVLAAPWGGGFAPDAEQIEGSRIVLKESLTLVDPAAAAAWWPFLMLCVLFYGFLPRGVLAVMGEMVVVHRVRRPPLADAVCERMVMRLTREALTFRSGGPADGSLPAAAEVDVPSAVRPKGAVSLQVPLELDHSRSRLAELAGERLEVPVERVTAEGGDEREAPEGGVVLLREVWQPPLQETLADLRDLRERLGPDVDITLLCTGYPEEEGLFQAPSSGDLKVWGRHLAELRDPHVQMVPW